MKETILAIVRLLIKMTLIPLLKDIISNGKSNEKEKT